MFYLNEKRNIVINLEDYVDFGSVLLWIDMYRYNWII